MGEIFAADREGRLKLTWDYDDVALQCLKRPPYSWRAVKDGLEWAEMKQGMLACDVGAGTAALTLMLLEFGLKVVALEPGQRMSVVGATRAGRKGSSWLRAVAEKMPLSSEAFDLVAFGSSFNVVERKSALLEAVRVSKPRGAFMCLWNHRDLADSLQQDIEFEIQERLPGYQHGFRRTDPSEELEASGCFEEVKSQRVRVVHDLAVKDFMEAWHSHLTLRRQAGLQFQSILEAIDRRVKSRARSGRVSVPYITVIWVARKHGVL